MIEQILQSLTIIRCDWVIDGEPCPFAATGETIEAAADNAERQGLHHFAGRWLCDANQHDEVRP